MKSTSTLLLALAAIAPLASAAPSNSTGATCDANTKCPTSAPCCSEYGHCNTGAFCLGGCQPLFSFQESSCAPRPICKSFKTDFSDLSRVANATAYKGNATAADWTLDIGKLVPDTDGVHLTLVHNSDGSITGTKISSTRYIHYGRIDFEMKPSYWGGIVSAAITMSDVHDEIDWEWPGAKLNESQSNLFHLGVIPTPRQGGIHSNGFDYNDGFHTFSFDWQEDQLQWLIDGNAVRTIKKSESYNNTDTAVYPTTPSRVQLSIWAAGVEGSAEGTREWAGGYIDWNHPDYVANGYFSNVIKSVTITCAGTENDDPSLTGYVYNGSDSESNPTVQTTNKTTIIGQKSSSMPVAGSVSLATVAAMASLPLVAMFL